MRMLESNISLKKSALVSAFIALGGCNKLPQTGELKTAEIYSRAVLKPVSLK